MPARTKVTADGVTTLGLVPPGRDGTMVGAEGIGDRDHLEGFGWSFYLPPN